MRPPFSSPRPAVWPAASGHGSPHPRPSSATTSSRARSLQLSHPLDALFRPRSVAIIGASSDANRIGGRPVRFSRYAFKGAIFPINPNQKEIQGLPAFASIRDVPGPVDQAIVALPAKAALQAVDDCIAKGVKAIVMFSSGFAETGVEGRAIQGE